MIMIIVAALNFSFPLPLPWTQLISSVTRLHFELTDSRKASECYSCWHVGGNSSSKIDKTDNTGNCSIYLAVSHASHRTAVENSPPI